VLPLGSLEDGVVDPGEAERSDSLQTDHRGYESERQNDEISTPSGTIGIPWAHDAYSTETGPAPRIQCTLERAERAPSRALGASPGVARQVRHSIFYGPETERVR
jgi:hypothetical protein